jgi:GNAT superfamily N-acetyltransferase
MKTLVPTGYAIEEIDLTGVSDEVVRPFVELSQRIHHEFIPEDPPQPFEAIAARVRTYTSLRERSRWAAWTAERELAGHLVMVKSTQDNLHIRDVWIDVAPEHRRRGIATVLLRHALDTLGDGTGLLVQLFTNSRMPASEAFARSIGATPGLRARSSQLDLARVDRAKMREWASIDPAGYRLEWIDGDTPDRLMDNVVTAIRTMNTMPREDLHMEDWKITPENLREWDRLRKAQGQQRIMVLAIDEATGETAGFTEIFFDQRVPSVIHQGGTATVPAHRGKGLGKWVKARMVERILREMPEARYVRTENAGSNDAMLAINVGMGFTPAWEETIWQVPVADARKALER